MNNSAQIKTIIPLGTISASGNSAPIDTAYFKRGDFFLVAANKTGTNPTLDVKLQASADGGGHWFDISGCAFSQLITTGQEMIANVTLPGILLRAAYTLGGSASPTFTGAELRASLRDE